MIKRKEPEKKQDLSLRELRIYQALHLFINASEEDCQKACDKLRSEIQRRINSMSSASERQLKAGRIDDAFSQLIQLRQVLRMEDKAIGRATDTIRTAKNLLQEKNYSEALKLFEEALPHIQAEPDVLMCAGTAALYSEAFDRAIYYSDLLLKKFPNDAQALTLKALAELSLNHIDAAYSLIVKAAKAKPDSSTIFKYLKVIESRMKEGQENPWKAERTWKRVTMRKAFMITDPSVGIAQKFHTLSLSAGGCLIEAPQLPETFAFTLDLGSPHGSIQGIGSLAYQLPNSKKGILFSRLRFQDQENINQEVLRALSVGASHF